MNISDKTIEQLQNALAQHKGTIAATGTQSTNCSTGCVSSCTGGCWPSCAGGCGGGCSGRSF